MPNLYNRVRSLHKQNLAALEAQFGELLWPIIPDYGYQVLLDFIGEDYPQWREGKTYNGELGTPDQDHYERVVLGDHEGARLSHDGIGWNVKELDIWVDALARGDVPAPS